MAPPRRAPSVSTRIVGFRLTDEEVQRLDQVVQDLGHKDRSSLLRAWLAQSCPVPRMADDASSHPEQAKTKKASAHAQERAGETETAQSNRDNDSMNQTTQSEKEKMAELGLTLRSIILWERDPRTGLSRIPNVVRDLLPRFSAEHIYAVIDLWCRIGLLVLHPKGRERLSREDDDFCPRTVEGTVFSHMRWMGKE